MRNLLVGLLLVGAVLFGHAAEQRFVFSSTDAGKTPAGFHSILAGAGKPGDWRVVLDDVPSAFLALTPGAPSTSKKAALGQVSTDATDERFPILLLNDESYGDFTLTTKFKIVTGVMEQMAGVAFRVQDEKNFYVIRASAMGNNIRFYKVVNGERGNLIGPEVPIAKGAWHELKIQCEGNQIRCWLNGKEAFPPLTDSSFNAGKLGFWTKSDSVSYFADAQLTYKPRIPLAKTIITEMMEAQPRLHGLKIFVPTKDALGLRVLASDKDAEAGQLGTKIEQDVFAHDTIYQAKDEGTVTVVMPLHDRNGETVGVVHVLMETFFGQTEGNVIARATPIVKALQMRVQSAKDLTN
ncbi:MAG: hypothetical protein RLZZ350_1145 [Verrucomicrobiota bacterium]